MFTEKVKSHVNKYFSANSFDTKKSEEKNIEPKVSKSIFPNARNKKKNCLRLTQTKCCASHRMDGLTQEKRFPL